MWTLISPEDRKSTRLNSSHMSISYAVFCLTRPPPRPTLFPYTTLFRSSDLFVDSRVAEERVLSTAHRHIDQHRVAIARLLQAQSMEQLERTRPGLARAARFDVDLDLAGRSEEHTSELQSHVNLVCRLLLDTPPTATYTLSLHDALPIFRPLRGFPSRRGARTFDCASPHRSTPRCDRASSPGPVDGTARAHAARACPRSALRCGP